MTLETNAFTTYLAKGNREDLTDVIYRISPTDTPFLSGIDKETASATYHEWQTQALATASSSNAQIEGDAATADAATATVRLGNYTQIARKIPRVTGTQQAVDHAGRGSEMAYQEMLKGLELKTRHRKVPARFDNRLYHGCLFRHSPVRPLQCLGSNQYHGCHCRHDRY